LLQRRSPAERRDGSKEKKFGGAAGYWRISRIIDYYFEPLQLYQGRWHLNSVATQLETVDQENFVHVQEIVEKKQLVSINLVLTEVLNESHAFGHNWNLLAVEGPTHTEIANGEGGYVVIDYR